MSGPFNSNDIEDVVSSVRRLVSVDVRQRPPGTAASPERLVLTPSLRVVADQPAAAPLMLTERAVEVEGVILQSGHPEPVTADPHEAAMAVDVDEGWEDDLWSDPDPALAELALAVEEAELVTAPDEAAPDDTAPDNTVDGPLVLDEKVSARARIEHDLDTARSDQVVPFPALAPEPPQASGRAPDPVPPVSTMPQTLTDTEGNPLTVLDEAALHDIIRQLIREELKGALGERITQNVRKLVRAEINRALTVRSLD